MCTTIFPEIDQFYSKLSSAIQKSGKENEFLYKWGLANLSEVYDILRDNIQGGYNSHKHSILSVPSSKSVLTIGPGMGFCALLLSELYDSVFVAEPDDKNCSIIKGISNHYITNRNYPASCTVEIFHAGISITDATIGYWATKNNQMKQKNISGSILNFVINGATELRNVLNQKIHRIYLHKVLSSLTILNSFENIVREVSVFLEDDGIITWSEPQYILHDCLQINDPKAVNRKLKQIVGKIGMKCDIEHYCITTTFSGKSSIEKWVLLKVQK